MWLCPTFPTADFKSNFKGKLALIGFRGLATVHVADISAILYIGLYRDWISTTTHP